MASKKVKSDSASGGKKLMCYNMEMKKEIQKQVWSSCF